MCTVVKDIGKVLCNLPEASLRLVSPGTSPYIFSLKIYDLFGHQPLKSD